jgi:teichuronic acid biosynthesis glycosyltransferase TuaH
LGERAVIYDITDDWISLTQSDRLQALVKAQDEALCRRAGAVIVCSDRLFQMKHPLTDSLYLIRNGVDASHYLSVCGSYGNDSEETNQTQEAMPEAAAWPHPVLGYTGTIHPDRLDVALTAELAREMDNHECLKNGSIVLIGPNLLSESDQKLLSDTGRIIFQPSVPYLDIPRWMVAFDVCIVPHLVNSFTESLNPIKLWEYMAAGLPIISTKVAGFRDYSELIAMAGNASAFAAAVADAVTRKNSQWEREQSKKRQALALKHSWSGRLDEIERVVTSLLS